MEAISMTGSYHLLTVRGKEIRVRTDRIVVAAKWTALLAGALAVTTAVGHIGLAIYNPLDVPISWIDRLMWGYVCLLALTGLYGVLRKLVKSFFEVNEVEHDD